MTRLILDNDLIGLCYFSPVMNFQNNMYMEMTHEQLLISGVDPGPSKDARVRDHPLNRPGGDVSPRIPASHPAPTGSQRPGRDQGRLDSPSPRENDLW